MSAAPHPDWLVPEWDAPQVRALMTTRAGGVSTGPYASLNVGSAVQDEPAAVEENRRRVAEALGAALVFLPQVHGSKVLRLKPEWARPDAKVPKADACVSTIPGLGCAIQVADCLPVLFAAPKAVGGAHAGWRGLADGVLENTVQALCEAAACEPGEVQAWFGASIGPEAFEVGADVLAAFGVEPRADLGAAQSQLFRYQPNAAGEPRWRANLPALAALRLRAAGVTRLSGGRWCTYSDPSRFFSYRRERLSGRLVAAITLA